MAWHPPPHDLSLQHWTRTSCKWWSKGSNVETRTLTVTCWDCDNDGDDDDDDDDLGDDDDEYLGDCSDDDYQQHVTKRLDM